MCPDTGVRRSLRLALVLGGTLLLTTAAPVRAQRLAHGVFGLEGATFGVIDLATGTSMAVTEDEAQVTSVFTADGQYAARALTTGLSIRHMPTGRQVVVPTDFLPRLAHSRRPMLFGVSAGRPARFDERGLLRWDVCGAQTPVPTPALDLTIDGRTLYVLCDGDLIGLDTETGVEVRRLAGIGVVGQFAVNADGSEVIGWRNTALPAELVRVSLATGQVLARRVVSAVATGGGMTPTPRRDRVVATSCASVSVNIRCSAVLVDAVSLADVRWLGNSIYFSPHVTVSPDGRDAFVAVSGFGASPAYASWIDVATGAIVASTSVPPGYGLGISYVPVPLPPESPSAVVAGHSVTLSWHLPAESPQASRYRAEIGTAPGATDLGVLPVGSGETFTVTGVPPGRYYVRFRAVNDTGTSAPSTDVVVDVP